jgi:alkyl hydroperoxide reductase subunit AhpC
MLCFKRRKSAQKQILQRFKIITKISPISCSRWVVLFSHPADFTPVCTTELGRIAVHHPQFVKRNTKLLALSCDKLQDHQDWVNVSTVQQTLS